MIEPRSAFRLRRAMLLLLVAAQYPLFSQIGPYPRGPYPGPGTGPGIPLPWPRRGKDGGAGTPAETVVRLSGRLRKIDDKTLTIQAEDGRMLEFRRSRETKFFKESREIAATELAVGDEVSVEARQDEQGYLYARNVYLLSASAASKNPPGSASPAPAARDADDPGPPVLRREPPPRRPVSDAADTEPPSKPAAVPVAQTDPLIAKARAAAESFSETLPNYICKQYMSRFISSSRPVDWKAMDIVSADIVFENGRESYRDVAVNGRPVHKSIEELGGAWSTGEFATMLRDLLSPATAAEFHFRGDSSSSGVPARVYDFEVRRPHSHWHVQSASQSIEPAYKGSVWIEPGSGRVLRIEMQAASLPREFPMDTVESAVDYSTVRIGEQQVLLPVHAENLGCQRGTDACSRNVIDFRNYHKYEADSSVTFSEGNQ